MPASPENERAVMNAIAKYVNASLSNYAQAIATNAPANVTRAAEQQAAGAAQAAAAAGVPVSQQVTQAVHNLESKILAIAAWRNLASITPNTASQKAYNNKAIALLNEANINNLLKNSNKSFNIFEKITPGNNKNKINKKLQNKAGARISRNIQQSQNAFALKKYLNSNLHKKRYSVLNNNNKTDPTRITKATVQTNINTKYRTFQQPGGVASTPFNRLWINIPKFTNRLQLTNYLERNNIRDLLNTLPKNQYNTILNLVKTKSAQLPA